MSAYIAICAIMKNEENYIYEWLSYHYTVGVRRFFIYDNGDTDALKLAIRAWPRADLVTVVDWPGQAAQVPAYQHCLVNFRDQAEWCAFIDTDEFLTPRLDLFSLSDILEATGRIATGLYVHWLFFGSSGHIQKPAGLITETYTKCGRTGFPSHRFGKTIVRMRDAVMTRHSHVIRSSGKLVSEFGDELDQNGDGGTALRLGHRVISLNHYFTKSRQEWDRKVAMGRVSKSPTENDYKRTDADFERHDLNFVDDTRAAEIMAIAKERFY